MLTQTGEMAIEQSNVNLNSQFLGPQPPDMMTSISTTRYQLLPMRMPENVPSVDGTVHHTKPNHPGIL
jgi:hypothetical protein